MTRSLAISMFVIAAMSLAIGTNNAEARHRRNRCCNTGFANYGYQTMNSGCCQNTGVSASGTGCAPGTWNGTPTYDGTTNQPQNNAAPPPPTESAPPVPRT